jgi:prepilin-type N-terminal cleavage/methylation domain-containing protein
LIQARSAGSENGFSMIELMVVLTLMSIGALAMSRLFINQARNAADTRTRSNVQQLRDATQRSITNPAAIVQSANQP